MKFSMREIYERKQNNRKIVKKYYEDKDKRFTSLLLWHNRLVNLTQSFSDCVKIKECLNVLMNY